jgi:chemotaxis protein MotB
VSHKRWLVSYADFITLLFAFFVVLFAFARADQKKQQEVTVAIDNAFTSLGVLPQSGRNPAKSAHGEAGAEQPVLPINIVMGEELMSAGHVKTDLEQMHRDLEHRLAAEVSQHTVAIKMGRDGLVISLKEAGFFDFGSATPHPSSIKTLREIAATLAASHYDVRVEGHTDNIPIHTAEFDSNWELSSARATHIGRILLAMDAVRSDQLSAAGYAEFHPVDTNATPEGRANNRRVDLVVQPRSNIDLRSPPPSPPGNQWRRITDSD